MRITIKYYYIVGSWLRLYKYMANCLGQSKRERDRRIVDMKRPREHIKAIIEYAIENQSDVGIR